MQLRPFFLSFKKKKKKLYSFHVIPFNNKTIRSVHTDLLSICGSKHLRSQSADSIARLTSSDCGGLKRFLWGGSVHWGGSLILLLSNGNKNISICVTIRVFDSDRGSPNFPCTSIPRQTHTAHEPIHKKRTVYQNEHLTISKHASKSNGLNLGRCLSSLRHRIKYFLVSPLLLKKKKDIYKLFSEFYTD